MTQFDVCLEMAGICLPDGRPLSMFIDRVIDRYDVVTFTQGRIIFKNGSFIFRGLNYYDFHPGTSKIPNYISCRFMKNIRELYQLVADIYVED